MKKIVFIATWILFSTSMHSQSDTTITTFSQVHQRFGGGFDTRTVVDTFIFPSDLTMVDTIQLRIQLNCPAGGCDPWDRFANLRIVKNGEEYEIGRYMTPYKKACGWAVDVTDYRNLLTDTVILKSFIDTWVNPAWLVTYHFDLKAGVPAYSYVKVDNLWQHENIVYGDTINPSQLLLPAMNFTTEPGAAQTIVRVVNTGHGQGNTNNAAEFSQKTHHLVINDDTVYSHLLWRNDCSSNPTCSNQQGTWQYARAGWCPGKAVDPVDFDITGNISPGIQEKYEYKLQEYFNACSPGNPGCTTSGSCPDCNYNYNGHTEPHYKIHIQVLQRFTSPLTIKNKRTDKKLQVVIYPNPSQSIVYVNANEPVKSLTIFSLLGEELAKTFSTEFISVKHLPEGMYLLKIEGGGNSTFRKIKKSK